jgi:hypothetical protein
MLMLTRYLQWLHESALMDAVYSNAVFNIAATSARDGSEGLFRERRPQDVELCSFEAEWLLGHRNYTLWSRKVWENQIHNSPLRDRSWVLQEMYLSRRNIHFGQRQVFWECKQLSACELLPTGCTGLLDHSKKLSPYSIKQVDFNVSSLEVYKAMTDWDEIILNYTRSSLTFGDDKLVAVSALAKYWQRQWKQPIKYQAGLWDEFLVHQLMWRPEWLHILTHPVLTTQQVTYRAPTWSWASINGPITVHSYGGGEFFGSEKPRRSSLIETPQIEIDLVSDDPFGQVRGGRLKISGRLTQIIIFNDGERWRFKKLQPPQLHEILSSKYLLQDNYYERVASGYLYFLPIMTTSHFTAGLGNFDRTSGLLLKKVAGIKGTFERFGTFNFGLAEEQVDLVEEHLLEEALNDFDLYAGESGLEYTVDALGKNKYNIIII